MAFCHYTIEELKKLCDLLMALLLRQSVKGRIICIEIFAIRVILCDAERITESLEVGDLSLAEEFDGIAHIGVIHEAKNIIVSDSGFLFWCNHIRTNFSEIPMNFYGNIPCSGDSLADRYVINQRFHDFAVKVFQVCVLFNEFAAVITNRNFVVDFG